MKELDRDKFIAEYVDWLYDSGVDSAHEIKFHATVMAMSLQLNPYGTLERLIEECPEMALPSIELLGKYGKLH